MNKILIVVGPTATGKTDLALSLAQKFDGELIACDSRQVFKGLDIGSGKLPISSVEVEKHQGVWRVQGVNIWLYDLVELSEQFSAYDWIREAKRKIKEVNSKGKLPIIVGGTGLYLNALLSGLDSQMGADLKLRKELEGLSLEKLQARVASLSPARWGQLNNSDKNNPRRLVRILEKESMYPYISKAQSIKYKVQSFDSLKIGLTAPRPWLNSKIDARVLTWFLDSILEEVRGLMGQGVPVSRFKELGLEYSLIAQYLNGDIFDKDKLIKLIQIKIRQYAKRQMTWFKRDPEIKWFDVSQDNWAYRVDELVENWYNSNEINYD